MAVDESETRKPVKRPARQSTPNGSSAAIVASVASSTCKPPPPKISLLILRQLLQAELDADREQQQDHAHLGRGVHELGVPDQSQGAWADHHTRDQEPDDWDQTEAVAEYAIAAAETTSATDCDQKRRGDRQPRTWPSLERGEIPMDEMHGDAAFTDGRRDTLHGFVAHVAGREHPGHAGFEQERRARRSASPSGARPDRGRDRCRRTRARRAAPCSPASPCTARRR